MKITKFCKFCSDVWFCRKMRKSLTIFFLKYSGLSGAKAYKSCRSRQEFFSTNIFLQNLASIQKRTSPIKFAHLAEKSEKSSISNLSTTALTAVGRGNGGATRRFLPLWSPCWLSWLAEPLPLASAQLVAAALLLILLLPALRVPWCHGYLTV